MLPDKVLTKISNIRPLFGGTDDDFLKASLDCEPSSFILCCISLIDVFFLLSFMSEKVHSSLFDGSKLWKTKDNEINLIIYKLIKL